MKSLLKVLSAFMLFSLTLTNLYASPIVDQSQVNWLGGGWYVNSNRSFAQTFTCGIGGQLSHVDILIDTWTGSPDYPSTFSIVNVVNGIPEGSVIGSVYTSGFTLGWNTIDFLSEGVFLNKDTQYAILVSNDDPDSEIPPSLGLGLDYENNYSGGMIWYWHWLGYWSNDFLPNADPGETDGVFVTWMVQEPQAIEVTIDIKPGSDPNPINQGSNGVVPVAIFSSSEFDATQVDPTSVSLAGASVAVRGKGKSMAHEEDVNGDGLVDLVVQVETQGFDDLGTGGIVELTGTTFGGEDIVGYDEVVIVPPDK